MNELELALLPVAERILQNSHSNFYTRVQRIKHCLQLTDGRCTVYVSVE
jgi:hypothetical protein